jgi:hypothetical protein
MNGVGAIKRVSGNQVVAKDLAKTILARIAPTQGKTLAMIAFEKELWICTSATRHPLLSLAHKLDDDPTQDSTWHHTFCSLFFFLLSFASAKTQQELASSQVQRFHSV